MKQLIALLFILLCTFPSYALNVFWTGNGSNNLWSNVDNRTCGLIRGEGIIDQGNGDFENNGWLLYESPGAVLRTSFTPIINRGIVNDLYARFGNILDSQKAQFLAIDRPQANVLYPNTVNLGGTANLVIQGFYTNSSGSKTAR